MPSARAKTGHTGQDIFFGLIRRSQLLQVFVQDWMEWNYVSLHFRFFQSHRDRALAKIDVRPLHLAAVGQTLTSVKAQEDQRRPLAFRSIAQHLNLGGGKDAALDVVRV